MFSKCTLFAFLPAAAWIVFLPAVCGATAAVPTVTVLTVSPSSSVSLGTVVTLTATVSAGGAPVSPGQVLFCKAEAPRCVDLAILGQAQLTSAGVATTRVRLGLGVHTIQAVFAGTPNSPVPRAPSSSSTESLTVSGIRPSSATLSIYGAAGDSTLLSIVGAYGRVTPTGTLSFLDLDRNGATLGSFSIDSLPALHYFVPSVLPGVAPSEAILAADVNNDGIPDLVSLGAAPPILLGNGDGTFRAAPPSTTSIPLGRLAVGDFNSDGVLDLAITGDGDPNGFVTIALGMGDGSFEVAVPIPITFNPSAPVVADFTGDGILDLALINPDGKSVSVLPGAGNGTFLSPISAVSLSGFALNILAGDFNDDGILDLVADSGPVAIYLGNGDGTFTYKVLKGGKLGTGGNVAIGDFNGDGQLDILTIEDTLLGTGKGTFIDLPHPFLFEDAYGGGPFLLSDFNADGNEDVITLNTPDIFFGNGDGTFNGDSHQFFPYETNDPWIGTVADFNGDGLADVLVSYQYGGLTRLGLNGFTTAVQVKADSLVGSGKHSIVASYSGDGSYAPSQSSPVLISNTTATPVLDPPPGSYPSSRTVRLSDATPGAAIYYTLDGTAPTLSSPRYSAPFQVTQQANIHALAISSTTGLSAVAGGRYSIDPTP